MRTMPMTWGQTKSAYHSPCAACGRELAATGKRYAVHVINGGADVLHPSDEAIYVPDGGEMGLHFIGSECRKRFGEFAIKWL